MKQLTLRFILPLTILSFAVVTKWWYVWPVDARQTFYWGFPLAYVGEGWQTSGALQFFLLEGLVDVSTYFAFWFVLTYVFWRRTLIQRAHRLISRLLWSMAILVILGGGFIIFTSYSTIQLTRDYDWEILDTGYTFIWQNTPPIEEEIDPQ
jgi:hypothetical protein